MNVKALMQTALLAFVVITVITEPQWYADMVHGVGHALMAAATPLARALTGQYLFGGSQ